jgi:hypothetical protein
LLLATCAVKVSFLLPRGKTILFHEKEENKNKNEKETKRKSRVVFSSGTSFLPIVCVTFLRSSYFTKLAHLKVSK